MQPPGVSAPRALAPCRRQAEAPEADVRRQPVALRRGFRNAVLAPMAVGRGAADREGRVATFRRARRRTAPSVTELPRRPSSARCSSRRDAIIRAAASRWPLLVRSGSDWVRRPDERRRSALGVSPLLLLPGVAVAPRLRYRVNSTARSLLGRSESERPRRRQGNRRRGRRGDRSDRVESVSSTLEIGVHPQWCSPPTAGRP